MQQTPPGWYPHPEGGLRWWNGQQWANPPSVTAATPRETGTQEAPEARVEPTAWTPSVPPPRPTGGSPRPLPKGRGPGRTVALVIGGLAAATLVASEVDALRENPAPALQPVASVSDPADGCQRFLALFSGLLRDKPNEAEAERRFEQLRDAARDNDPLLASDMQDILNGDNAADVSAATQIIVRRCGAAGHITQDDVNMLGAAAMSAMGAATAAPKPRSAAPAPAKPATDVAGGVAAAQIACDLYAYMFSVDVPIEDSDEVFEEAADASQRAALADLDAWQPLRDAMHRGLGLYTSTDSDGAVVVDALGDIERLCDEVPG
jgi:hypothetical protein